MIRVTFPSINQARLSVSCCLALSAAIAILSAAAVRKRLMGLHNGEEKDHKDPTIIHPRDNPRTDNTPTPTPTDNGLVFNDQVPSVKNSVVVVENSSLQREQYKEQRRLLNFKHWAMKKIMYDNICMVCPNGERLCTISKKKANWYVDKKLAQWVSTGNQEQIIQLLFEPKHRSSRGELGLYIRTDKINQCVVCGEINNYMRHYIVPYAYRTLLPTRCKSHLSHDIVILCFKCNHKCERQKQLRMNEMEDASRLERRKIASYTADEDKAFFVNPELYKVRSCALALKNWKDKLPIEKIAIYESVVRSYFERDDPKPRIVNDTNVASSPPSYNILTPELLQQAIDLEYRVANPTFISGSQILVESLEQDDNKIEAFIKDWRHHFLRIARPKFLPTGWDVDSPVFSGVD